VASGNAAVSNATNESVLDGKARARGRVLTIPLRAGLKDGVYSVRWSIVSDDGHPERSQPDGADWLEQRRDTREHWAARRADETARDQTGEETEHHPMRAHSVWPLADLRRYRFLTTFRRAAGRGARAGLAFFAPFLAAFATTVAPDLARAGGACLATTRELFAGADFLAGTAFGFAAAAGGVFASTTFTGVAFLAGGAATTFGFAAVAACAVGGAFGLLFGRPPLRAN